MKFGSAIGKFLGYVWASPVTFVGLTYASLFAALGWYKWLGVRGDALVYIVNREKSPSWLKRAWYNWAGQAIGNVVVLISEPTEKDTILKHELKHVDQVMRLGVFQPIVYAINLLAIKIGCPGSDPYFSNPMEIDARRAAGQVIDMEGALAHIKSKQV